MTSWVHVFSKFTPEALLFEALLISILLAGYAAFWVLRKRRLGSVDSVVPTGVVKTYLNELIIDAERLRAQLFGLLAGTEAMKHQDYSQLQAGAAAMQTLLGAHAAAQQADPEAAQRLQVLEAQMSQQSAALEAVMEEKKRLEADLAAAKSANPADSAGGASQTVVMELQSKLRTLENKLAEYSVIEDDLANLKRLQQENAQLRAALNGGAAAAATSVPAAAPAAEPQAAAQPAAEPAPVASAAAEAPAPSPLDSLSGHVDQSAIDNLFSTAPEAAPAAASPEAQPAQPEAPAVAATAPDALFEGLVDQVEKSLQSDAPAQTAATTAEAPTSPAPAAPTSATGATSERSDADLVAEFEKMLNG